MLFFLLRSIFQSLLYIVVDFFLLLNYFCIEFTSLLKNSDANY